MDFSNLIGKEIQKKKDSHSGKKRPLGRREKRATLTIAAVCEAKDINIESKQEEVTDKVEEQNEQNSINAQQEQNVIPYTNEEMKLSNDISIEEIDSKLASFDEFANEPNISKLAKLRKLGILLRKQEKDKQYESQLEKERNVEMDLKISEMGNPEFDETIYLQVRKYIKYLVKCWESSEYEKDQSLLLETKRDLVRILYKLRKQNLKPSMFASLTTTIYYLQIQDFTKANEAYLKLSIGNATWPIGVRSVGIHQRSADLKITGDNKKNAANIMIDDMTRRWLTGIKRLISFCERSSKNMKL